MPTAKRKLVIVGDGSVGKTCLLIRFAADTFPEVYVPSLFENYVADIRVDQKDVELALWDTSYDGEYRGYRPPVYPGSHVVLLAYSIDSPDSLENIMEKWITEVYHFVPQVPVILVGCKKDLRDDERILKDLARTGQRPVTFNEGLTAALRIGAGQFFECSAKTGEGVPEIFEIAARAAMDRQTRRRAGGSCIVV
ncbi:small GTPase-binding protein [Flagelloscypha sp. PMI_526]|nr:small GTPase-binding protein [Flagelloscypha sp. PMI_526]